MLKRDITPFGLRIPSELKEWLRERAYENRRSLNSEIEHRLVQGREQEKENAA